MSYIYFSETDYTNSISGSNENKIMKEEEPISYSNSYIPFSTQHSKFPSSYQEQMNFIDSMCSNEEGLLEKWKSISARELSEILDS